MCEHGGDVKTLSDVEKWKNPRIKTSPKATTGKTLHKILTTMEIRYNVDFLFCSKGETGGRIVEILSREFDKN